MEYPQFSMIQIQLWKEGHQPAASIKGRMYNKEVVLVAFLAEHSISFKTLSMEYLHFTFPKHFE